MIPSTGTRRKVLTILAATAATLAMAESRPAQAGCQSDSQCKGARICEGGNCVDPPPAPRTQNSPAPASAAAPAFPQPVAPGAAVAPTQAPATGWGAPTGIPNAIPAPQPSVAPVNGFSGAMQLTEAQLADLKSAGAPLDAKDMEMADNLGKRGFSGDDFVAAYREHNAMKATYPELVPYGRAMVETIAVAHKLGLSENDKYKFVWARHQRNRTLTQAYNEAVQSGPGMFTFGAVSTGTGLVLLIVGLELYSWGSTSIDSDPNVHNDEFWGNWRRSKSAAYSGVAMAITGGVVAAAGISFASIGVHRWATPLPDGTLDSGTADKIQSLQASTSNQPRSTVRWALTPNFGPHRGGLGLTAAF